MPRGYGFGVALLTVGLALMAGCSRPVVPPAGAGCSDARDCSAGQACAAGICSVGGTVSCITDLDCSVDGSQICSAGLCAAAAVSSSGCTTTAECTIEDFCNTATGLCSPLLENWCRTDDQCRTSAPVCSNRPQGENAPGRCQECLAASDCSAGESCNAAGVCQGANACPANATADGAGNCKCNVGFADNGSGGCEATSGSGGAVEPVGEGEGEGEPTTPSEGEGEGEGEGDFGGSCSEDFECWQASGNDNTMCGTNDQCVCDELFLFLVCDSYDPVACACVDNCEGLDYQGECQGDVLRWCEDGRLNEFDCSDDNATCGLIDADLGYDCR